MDELTNSGHRGLDWPADYAEILPVLLSVWGIDGEIYLSRKLSGGKSGALVYSADLATKDFTGQAILKLDKASDSGDQERHEAALHERAVKDAPDFAAKHLPQLLHSTHHGDQIAILSTIAGRGLEYAEPWIDCSHDRQLNVIRKVSRGLLEDWNADYRLGAGMRMPQELLQSWLGYRLDPAQGGRLHSFFGEECSIAPDTPSITFDGHWYPNPLAFAEGTVEIPDHLQMRAALGHCHCDFHGLNLLTGLREESDSDYYLIDLALYMSEQYLFYDHAYFEIASLLFSRGGASAKDWKAVVEQLGHYAHQDERPGLRTDDIGLIELVRTLRQGETDWIERYESDRLSFLENQALLARVAVGLNFANKRMPLDARQMAFYYAAAILKDYLALNRVDWPRYGPAFEITTTATEPANDRTPPEVSSPIDPKASELDATSDAPATSLDTVASAPRRRLGMRIAVLSAVAAGLLAVAVFSQLDFLLPRDDASTAKAPIDSNLPPDPDAQAATSLAVLPFTNLGGDDSFVDGLTIDIASVFARTGMFKMPGMSSTFQFKGHLGDARAIGQALNVDYLLEGTVLRNYDNLRIVASLVRAEDGFLIWSQTFESTTSDVFKTQEQIAEAIGAELATPLDIDANILQAQRTDNPRAYELFVRGLALLEHRGLALQDAMAVLERAVAMNENFAAAWGALSLAYNLIPTFVKEIDGRPVNVVVYYRKAKEAALKAQRIDPDLPVVRHAIGYLYQRERQWAAAEDAFQAALRNDPYAHRVMLTYAALLYTVGKSSEARTLVEEAHEIDPLNELYNLWANYLRWQGDQTEENIKPIESIFRRSPQYREIALRIIIDHRARTGELDKARNFIETCGGCSDALRTKALAMLDAASVEAAEQLFATYKDANIMGYQFLYAVGGDDVTLNAFQYYAVEANRRLVFFTVPWTLASVLAQDKRFYEIADDAGLVDYWRHRGWPDDCEPATDDRLTCS